jgi:hypothetical protein
MLRRLALLTPRPKSRTADEIVATQVTKRPKISTASETWRDPSSLRQLDFAVEGP